jgi:hypothetical protein
MRGRLARLVPHLVIGAFVYTNAAVILAPVTRRFLESEGLPVPAWIADAFNVFGVFWTYETINREILIEGLPRGSDRWIRLDPDELLPFPRGERLTRAWASRPFGDLPTMSQEEAFRVEARKMRERYGRLHPGKQLRRIRILLQTWPRSRRGYEKEKDRLETTTWYAD